MSDRRLPVIAAALWTALWLPPLRGMLESDMAAQMAVQLPLLIGCGCEGHFPYSFVDWYSPGAGTARTVIGGPAGGGYVTGAVLYRAS